MWQSTFSLLEQCPFPVISCAHGHCVGLGIDMTSAADIRLCTTDTQFSVAEINVGLAADVGTLQRLPKIVGNQGWVREVCFSGRLFDGKEAVHHGLCQHLFETKDDMMTHAATMAENMAQKSHIAMRGTKKHLVEALDKPIAQGLNDILVWNASMLQQPMWKAKM